MIPAEAWPAGDLLEWHDDETRTHHDFLNETTRPYSDEENAAADSREAERAMLETREGLVCAARDFLSNGAPTHEEVAAQLRRITRLVLGES